MENWDFGDLALELSDLEVALLLCLVAQEHCLIETTHDCIHDVAKELALISSNTFGLSYKILDCSSATSIDDFCHEIVASDIRRDDASSFRHMTNETSSNLSLLQTLPESNGDDKLRVQADSFGQKSAVNVVIAKNFDQVDGLVQVQALELMRSKKLSSPNGVLSAPADFLLLPLVVRSYDQTHPRLNMHLIDHLFISHFHDSSDSYVHLEDDHDWLSDGQVSLSSVVHKPDIQAQKASRKLDQQLLEKFRAATDSVSVGADVFRYEQDIVVFLRLSRAVAGGISAKANNHFTRFSKLLATLHGLDYLTPSIAALAAKKVFRHRIIVAKPEDDRSLQYGSDYRAVSHVLTQVNPETILDSVLGLEAPL